MKVETVTILGYRVFNGEMGEIPIQGPARVIGTISPNSYGIATRDEEFRAALRGADYLALDGVYFGLAATLLQGKRVRVNNGPSLFRNLMERLNADRGSAFFLGSTRETLDRMQLRAAVEWPSVRLGSFSPPFRREFTQAEDDLMVTEVNRFKPDVVFVGMTAPKQEKWAYRCRDRVSAGLIVSVGAVFDWFAGREKEIARIWWRLHLGWFVRTVRRPAILKRYPDIGTYFVHLVLSLLRLRRFD